MEAVGNKRLEDPQVGGIVLYSRDVTDMKRAEESLRESERRYRSLFESMLHGYAHCEMLFENGEPRDFVYLDVNAAFEELTGLKDVVGKRVTEVIPGIRESSPELFQLYGRVARTGVPERLEIYVDPLDIWFAISAYSPGKGHFVALFDNVSERKRAEKALRQSEERYRQLFERNLAGVFRSTLSGRLLDCNDAFARIYGYASAEEILAHPAVDLYFEEGLREEFVGRIRREKALVNYEERGRRKDGSLAWVLGNYTLVPDASGEETIIEGTLIDITERKQLEEQFRQAQKMEAVGQLAGGVAHDFNNLLTAILGYAELLGGHVRGDEALREGVEEIRKAGERAATLTRQLLAFSRRQMLEPKVIDLNEVVRNIEKMLRRMIGEDIDLTTSLDPELGAVRADAGQIEQVIMNIVVNARDAMPGGGKLVIKTGNVELDEDYSRRHVSARPGWHVVLSISDTGAGMDEATQRRVFEPFFTTKEKGKGTGLGLSTVYGIVKQSGGWVWVYSEPGRGTIFKVYLPRVESPAEPLRARPEEAAPKGGTETILLVEDEEMVRSLARKILTSRGYRVIEARDGEEAVESARQSLNPVDLVLTDMVLPGMGGSETASKIRVLAPEVKVLFMSGYTEDLLLRHAPLETGTAFLEKPFTPVGLARKVREVLDA